MIYIESSWINRKSQFLIVKREQGKFIKFLWKDGIWHVYANGPKIARYSTKEEASEHLQKYFKLHPEELAEHTAQRILGS